MPPTTEAGRAAELARRLRALPVEVETLEVDTYAILVPSYGAAPRFSSIATLHGAGCVGRGEHVGWSSATHERFCHRSAAATPQGQMLLRSFCEALKALLPEPYDRAALEAAAIDLALQQADNSLHSLIGAPRRDTRYVLSFAPTGDPVEEVRRAVGESPGVQVKIDVDAQWSETEFEGLARTGRIAVLDWKRGGLPAQHEIAHQHLPTALQEDAGPDPLRSSPGVAFRCSVDASFTHATALDNAPAPIAANVKPARMGGVLEAIDGVARCAQRDIQVYFGGMFELHVGRTQLLALASLLAPDGPNDIAPIERTNSPIARPLRLTPQDSPGFG